MPEKQLEGDIVPVKEITAMLVGSLYRLYAAHYDGANFDRFQSDLYEKDWVLLFRDSSNDEVVGFSTQMVMNVEVEGRRMKVLFSGDTIIHPDYWGSQALVHAWCRLAGEIKAKSPSLPLYWFLISKGYRTYLYLPCFFHRFYPSRSAATPAFEQTLMHILGRLKYPDLYDSSTGLIRHQTSHDRLKDELDVTLRRLHNPHVAFFCKVNPQYAIGDELVCVAELSAENMRSTAKRHFEIGLHGCTKKLAGSVS
jgi:hypothetical protein